MGWMASLPFVLSIIFKVSCGFLTDKIGRSAPILMAAMFFAGCCVYLGAVTEQKYLSAMIGFFINTTGQYSGGLLCLVFTGAAATIAAGVLAAKRY